MQKGIQARTNYKITPQVDVSDASLPDRLKKFYAQFEALNHTPGRKTSTHVDKPALSLSTADGGP